MDCLLLFLLLQSFSSTAISCSQPGQHTRSRGGSKDVCSVDLDIYERRRTGRPGWDTCQQPALLSICAYLLVTIRISSEKHVSQHAVGMLQEQQQEVLKLITGQLLKDQEAEAKAKKQKEEAEANKQRMTARAREIAAAAAHDMQEEPEVIPSQVTLLSCRPHIQNRPRLIRGILGAPICGMARCFEALFLLACTVIPL